MKLDYSVLFINTVYILIGSIFLTIGVVCFLVPNYMVTGGTAGLSLLLHHLINSLSIGMWMMIINIPLLLIGIKYFGKVYAIKSIFTISIISIFIDIAKEYLQLESLTSNEILASIYGGICIGLGLGLVIKAKSSAGGTTIIATIISSKTQYKASEVLLVFDGIIIFLSIFVFHNNDKVLFSILSMYVTSKIIDVILSGRATKKTVHLVTNKTKEISKEIIEKLGPHGTILRGDDLNEEKDKKMILLVIEASKIQTLRDIIKNHDSNAFLVVADASEIHGRGN